MNSGDAILDMICMYFGYCSSSPSLRERIEVRVGNSASVRKIENYKISGLQLEPSPCPLPLPKGEGP